MSSSFKVQLILLFVLLLFTKTACFFEFLKGNRNKENSEANQKALRQKQIQTEQGNQEKVKLLDKIARTRGVPLHDVDRYTKDVFVCDGARKLPISTVNDGFCDCNDGTDEPGTSACSNSVFYCLNDGYKMTKLSSSRVDDQICDCCDGSDEGEIQINYHHRIFFHFFHIVHNVYSFYIFLSLQAFLFPARTLASKPSRKSESN